MRRGTCVECGRDVAVRLDGTIRLHGDGARDPWNPNFCDGSEKPPVEDGLTVEGRCPYEDEHMIHPEGQEEFRRWAENMIAHNYVQLPCGGCGRYEIWAKRTPRKVAQ